jgi:acyl dehydratase
VGSPLDRVGTRYAARAATVDAAAARAYAAATNDPNPAYGRGQVPPLFAVVPAWESLMEAVTDLVPAEHLARILHGEQDVHVHRPLVPGATISTWAEAHSVRAARTGTRVTVRLVSEDGAGPLVEQFSTMFVRGLTVGGDAGPEPPGHAFPEEARQRPVGEWTRSIDADQTYRYRDASGDHNPIHVDEEAARAVRLPGIVVHGLCTMAMCGAAVVDGVAGGDPARLARLAVRFSWPVFPGHDLSCAVYEVGTEGDRAVYAFEATSKGKVVVRDGQAEVRVAPAPSGVGG